MREKSFKIRLTGIFAISILGLSTPAMAVDGSDSEEPKVQSVRIINKDSSIVPGERLIIEVKTGDDKNKVSLIGSISYIPNYPKEYENLSPFCKDGNSISGAAERKPMDYPYLGFVEDKSQYQDNGKISQTFYLIMNVPSFKSSVPEGCPDLRDPKYINATLNLRLTDEVNRFTNTSLIVDVIPKSLSNFTKSNYFCIGASTWIPQIESTLKMLPNNSIKIKLADSSSEIDIDLKTITNAKTKMVQTKTILDNATIDKLQDLPICNSTEFMLLSNATNLYFQIQSEAKKLLQKSRTISCIKGKIIKKITGRDPKCPPGFKRK